MGKTWSHKERGDKNHKKSFIRFKDERKSKRRIEEPSKKKDRDGETKLG